MVSKTGNLVNCSFCNNLIYKPKWKLIKLQNNFCNRNCQYNYRKGKQLKVNIENVKLAVSKNFKGKKKTKEHIQKIVQKRKENNSYNITQEHIEKLINGRKNSITHNKGKTKDNYEPVNRTSKKLKIFFNDEGNRKKLSEKVKQAFIKNPILKQQAFQRRLKQIFPKQDTKIEKKIENFLIMLNINYKKHEPIINIENAYQCDFLLDDKKLIIECDGDYWHNYPFGRNIDKKRTIQLNNIGFNVIRLWEHDIKKMNINEFQNLIFFSK
jgi:very-short-patch-repair endonuclease